MYLNRPSRLSPENLSAIIGAIYDCALDPAGWVDVLITITDAMDAAYSTISLTSPSDSHGQFAAASPWDPQRMRDLQGYALEDIPGLMLAVKADVDEPIATLSAMSEPELQRSFFYREWVQPQSLREACIVKFVHSGERIGLLGCTTKANRSMISAEEISFFALLSPHVRRAAMIGDLLDHKRVQTANYQETLDLMATAIVLTDERGRVVHANTAALAMDDARGPLSISGGQVRIPDPMAQRALERSLLCSAEDDRLALGGQGIAIPIRRAGYPLNVAYVLPLRGSGAGDGLASAAAAVFISQPGHLPNSIEMLAGLFNLTPTEARVMSHIGTGMNHDAAASVLGIGRNTLKTHLARVFNKTGASGQAELMRTLAHVTAPLRA